MREALKTHGLSKLSSLKSLAAWIFSVAGSKEPGGQCKHAMNTIPSDVVVEERSGPDIGSDRLSGSLPPIRPTITSHRIHNLFFMICRRETRISPGTIVPLGI